jgi:kynureninase
MSTVVSEADKLMSLSRSDCLALDAADPLAPFLARFHRPQGLLYFDGNSLGMLSREAKRRAIDAIEREWGEGLIESWTAANWIDLPEKVGGKIAKLIGAGEDEVIATDSTSINIFKLLAGALKLRPGRRVILTESGNFPTDIYMAEGLAHLTGDVEVRLADDIMPAITEDVAVALVTHVDYRSAALHDMAAVTAAAHAKGALMIWDLSHSAGAVPVNLGEADFAVGCGYKFLNGGPGAPAYLHVARNWQKTFAQPLSGWLGHAAPFAFEPHYRPASGMKRAICGTPSVIAMSILDSSLDLLLEAGIERIHAKARKLMDLFAELMDTRCADAGLRLISPRDHAKRGSHLSYSHPHGYELTQALRERRVVPDFRAPDLIRFGFTPLTMGFADVWDAVDRLAAIWREGAWRDPRHAIKAAVT